MLKVYDLYTTAFYEESHISKLFQTPTTLPTLFLSAILQEVAQRAEGLNVFVVDWDDKGAVFFIRPSIKLLLTGLWNTSDLVGRNSIPRE